MSPSKPVILVTGASGQLGRLVVEELLKTVPQSQLVATARNVDALADLEARGVEVRQADFSKPDTMDAAFKGVDKLLLISSSEIGQRGPQHLNAINAAKAAGVSLIAYTSVLHADTSTLDLAIEHRETEQALAEAGVPYVLLRNGWYTENHTASIPPALAHGAFIGCANEGKISSASRGDFAAAASAVLTAADDQAGRTYELAGDATYTLEEFTAEVAKQSGKPVVYQDLSQDEYKVALVGAGIPNGAAHIYAQSDAAASRGALFDDGRQLSKLIGRATTPYATTIGEALAG
ncbi:SDR family oxidoreductase [Mycolicibacterium stellerae]|uniref:SDR family oxidoreductase n=1 Tax=Mycolicibacterium stellerae TaxID=2358193 RepID=UPI000F0B8D9E|nr:SDR family oxidoreductase [Mycolicibacterium stellerae]